jgi:hypothetical protein
LGRLFFYQSELLPSSRVSKPPSAAGAGPREEAPDGWEKSPAPGRLSFILGIGADFGKSPLQQNPALVKP